MSFSLNKYYFRIRNTAVSLAVLPCGWLLFNYFSNGLMPNPFVSISKILGHSALILIFITLSASPIRLWVTLLFRKTGCRWGRRLSDWNFLIRLRRPLGVIALLYACSHFIFYLYFELDFVWEELYYELMTRHFIFVGMLAFLITLVLGLTSVNRARRSMGKWWLALHKLNYLLCILVVIHYCMFSKIIGVLELLYIATAVYLLGHRIVIYFWNPNFRDDNVSLDRQP